MPTGSTCSRSARSFVRPLDPLLAIRSSRLMMFTGWPSIVAVTRREGPFEIPTEIFGRISMFGTAPNRVTFDRPETTPRGQAVSESPKNADRVDEAARILLGNGDPNIQVLCGTGNTVVGTATDERVLNPSFVETG